ncbi:MAG: hypothetical protein DCC55_37585 [Chloroflexi bacterium]|nr:MAG: hypothetical protein DCC55_37585 [Chloroflexota bacterium]
MMQSARSKSSLPPPPRGYAPWVDYLTEPRADPKIFLRDMLHGVESLRDEKTGKRRKHKTGKVRTPDDAERVAFVDALISQPSRVDRQLALVMEASASGESMLKIVMDLTEAWIRRLDTITIPEPLDTEGYTKAVASWLAGIRESPLKAVHLKTLLLLLHFGRYRELVDRDRAVELIALAIRQQPKSSSGSSRVRDAPPTPLDLLLVAAPELPILSMYVSFVTAQKAAVGSLVTQVQAQEQQIERLVADSTKLRHTIEDLRTENLGLRQKLADAAETVAQMREETLNTRITYEHRMAEQRGRIAGMFQNQMKRWLEESLHAIRSNPPRIAVIEERLEEALALTDKELQWLRPSE